MKVMISFVFIPIHDTESGKAKRPRLGFRLRVDMQPTAVERFQFTKKLGCV
jgi:hypothetical protein